MIHRQFVRFAVPAVLLVTGLLMISCATGRETVSEDSSRSAVPSFSNTLCGNSETRQTGPVVHENRPVNPNNIKLLDCENADAYHARQKWEEEQRKKEWQKLHEKYDQSETPDPVLPPPLPPSMPSSEDSE